MRKQVVYIHDLCVTLTFDLYLGGGGILKLSEFYSQFLSYFTFNSQGSFMLFQVNFCMVKTCLIQQPLINHKTHFIYE